ncbi:uncharacterized protein LOC112514711 [Cynara cardunculus var. scolymus]|uniref:uncharacterized protein LOC112514711 n=1 Tax=Cynara cardunculus var. scolymus TaxID=59895 RepID=UPI000D62B11B|nr:uncharacterized protein LOC112514711 [Cynara cardunculus var. scolymus]
MREEIQFGSSGFMKIVYNIFISSYFRKTKSLLGFGKILDIRESIRPHFFVQIDDGSNTNAWEDNWLPIGPLSHILSYRSIHRSSFDANSSILEVVNNLDGCWPPDWNSSVLNLSTCNIPQIQSDARDKVLWLISYNALVSFAVREVWGSLDGVYDADRMRAWKDDPPDLICPMCHYCMDSHNQLFFECGFLMEIWTIVKQEAGMVADDTWSDILHDISSGRSKIRSSIHKPSLATSIHHVWRERN